MIISLRISAWRVLRRDREVAFLVADLVAEIREFLATAVPDAPRCYRCSRKLLEVWPKRMSSKMKNSASGPKNAVSAMPVLFKYASALAGDVARVAAVRFVRDRVHRVQPRC